MSRTLGFLPMRQGHDGISNLPPDFSTPQFATTWNDVDNLPPTLPNFNLDTNFIPSGMRWIKS
jgi:hypothetical protein